MASVGKILENTEVLTFEYYEADYKTKDVVEPNFEIIGKAASRIPDEFKKLHTVIEWRVIKDFRNIIIHEYFGINNQIVWDTIQFRLPDLLQVISNLISVIE